MSPTTKISKLASVQHTILLRFAALCKYAFLCTTQLPRKLYDDGLPHVLRLENHAQSPIWVKFGKLFLQFNVAKAHLLHHHADGAVQVTEKRTRAGAKEMSVGV